MVLQRRGWVFVFYMVHNTGHKINIREMRKWDALSLRSLFGTSELQGQSMCLKIWSRDFSWHSPLPGGLCMYPLPGALWTPPLVSPTAPSMISHPPALGRGRGLLQSHCVTPSCLPIEPSLHFCYTTCPVILWFLLSLSPTQPRAPWEPQPHLIHGIDMLSMCLVKLVFQQFRKDPPPHSCPPSLLHTIPDFHTSRASPELAMCGVVGTQ